MLEDLPELENSIIEKTDNLRALIKREDSTVLESITLRKSPANGELSNISLTQLIPNLTRESAITKSSGKYSS